MSSVPTFITNADKNSAPLANTDVNSRCRLSADLNSGLTSGEAYARTDFPALFKKWQVSGSAVLRGEPSGTQFRAYPRIADYTDA
jgi:hypothetical protein